MTEKERDELALQLIRQTAFALKALCEDDYIPQSWRDAINEALLKKKCGKPVKESLRDREITRMYLELELTKGIAIGILAANDFYHDPEVRRNLLEARPLQKSIESKIIKELDLKIKDPKEILNIVRRYRDVVTLEIWREKKAEAQRLLVYTPPEVSYHNPDNRYGSCETDIYRPPDAVLEGTIADINKLFPRLNVEAVQAWVRAGKVLGD